MSHFGPKNLQAKFLLGLGAIVLLLGAFFASSLYFHLSSLLDTQVKDRADLMFSQVNSVQRYVRETLRPKMYETLPEGEFIIEAMSSSYITRAVMDRLDLSETQYHYRRVAENSRNPQYEINEAEHELLDYFRLNPGQKDWEGYQKIDGRDYFVKVRPVVFKKSCLSCHGVPSDSPAVLLERYGSERGFGHRENGIDGLMVVGVPIDGSVARIREATMGYAVLYGGGMLIFFGLVQMFFNRLIMHNLHRLSTKFRALFEEEAEYGVMEKLDQEDEIEEVVQGLEELGEHLHDMHNQLRQHSENLEEMVEVRTGELQLEAKERRADVGLFVALLDGLNRSHTRRHLWQQALPLIYERFNAKVTGFTCMLASHTYYTWPEDAGRPPKPDNWKEILVDGVPHFEDNAAFVSVGASSVASEGILYLAWDEGEKITEQDRNVLRALGQQLGIAMENITALNNLLQQKDMLQVIVEGIGDPLLLMDGAGNVVLANEAARVLARSLGDYKTENDYAVLFRKGGVFEIEPKQGGVGWHEPVRREVIAADGRVFMVHVYPVAGGAADEGRGIVYIRDVTQERQMLSAMQQSEKLATVGQLAAGLAHEMNNPLGVIKCYAELLRAADDDHPVAEDAQVILKHANQAQNVLQNLLNFARPKQVEPASLDVGQVVDNAISVFQVQADKKGVAVGRDVDGGLPNIVSNEQAVEQILANLLKNALDAVESDAGRIMVSVRGSQEFVEITVADNGPGIPKGDLKRLFDPFFTTKEIGRGTGLGLAVVYGLIKELGGSIDVENAGGAIFTIHLPAPRSPEESA